ncbi:MAG: HEPN domain-containing protein, partial [Candidatus Heimdallarchaeota archaeon]|nr:HEPN domain-containing protein [Candidatus Heimdallarchaeota archaeon]MCK4254883.1 HEPN domain-containing protein [Candidatus Heimdallarchaeota archaeon]
MRSNKEENWKKWFKEKGKKLEIEEKMDYGYFFELLDIADDDLIASNILYRKKFYAHSIYLLQQAIEKLGKSILLHEGFCNKSDLKNKV